MLVLIDDVRTAEQTQHAVLGVAALERAVSRRGRTGAFDVVVGPHRLVRVMRSVSAGWDLRRYAAVVVVLGRGAMARGAGRRWRAQILQAVGPLTGSILVVVTAAADPTRPARRRGAMPEWLVDLAHDLPPDAVLLEPVTAEVDWSAVADRLAELLADRPDTGSEGAVVVPERRSGLAGRLHEVTRDARTAFDTDSAAVNLTDEDQLVTVAGDGAEVGAQPVAGSMCELTITQRGLVVIADALAMQDLRSYRAVQGVDPVRFYAGYPVRDPAGRIRGALCVYDHEARDADEFDFTMLRDLALLAEGELAHA